MKKFRFLFLLILITICNYFTFAQHKFNGKVVEVVDGKTVVIEVEPTQNKLTAVLQYIEVPEPEQELHKVVKDHLQTLLLGKQVEFSVKKMLTSKTVAQIFLDDVDISQQMLRDGAAWYAILDKETQDPAESENYRTFELQAKIEKLGVWSIANLKPAWEFRAAKEEKSTMTQQPETFFGIPAKNKSIFGQPRFNAETSLQQSNDSMDMWGGDIGSYFSDENVNAAGLASRYVSQFDIGYLATTIKNFNLSANNSVSKMVYRIIYYYKGSTLKSGDDTFFIGFLSESKNWQFLQSNNLSVITDGQTISLGKAYRLFRKDKNVAQELLLYKIRRDNLAKISNSKQVNFRVGKYSGVVEKTSQSLIGSLLDYTK
jgi:micrococcal nuclease